MRHWQGLGWWLLAAACGGAAPAGADAAAAAFAAFQAALQRGDERACRDLLTLESGAALAQLPWDRVRQQQPLQVLGATPQPTGGWRVQIADPNRGGAAGEFVVVREHGRLCVDLVASAGLTAVEAAPAEAAARRSELQPRALTPADFERIRQFELAQPRR